MQEINWNETFKFLKKGSSNKSRYMNDLDNMIRAYKTEFYQTITNIWYYVWKREL